MTRYNLEENGDHSKALDALHLLQKEYPGLRLGLELRGKKGWRLKASGPCGALVMAIPSTLRGETITAACQMVCRANVALRGAEAAPRSACFNRPDLPIRPRLLPEELAALRAPEGTA